MQTQRILDFIDGLLDPITSYKLVLYFLYVLVGWAILAGAISHKSIAFHWYDIVISTLFLMAVCRGVNFLLSYSLNVPRNSESDLITALILSMIMSPATTANDFLILGLAASFAMASKYVLVISKRHIFNPAATGAYLSGLVFHHYASWWVGTTILTPVVLVGGLLIMRKMKRYIMVTTFIVIYLIILGVTVAMRHSGSSVPHNLWVSLTASPLLFFSYIMLTEPLTSPNKLINYIPYSALVAVLYGVTKLRIPPEEALLIGNAFAYIIAPYKRLKLNFVGKRQEAEGIYSFAFSGKDSLNFQPGQYLEWTIPSSESDNRGNRRYFTISSSPTEKELGFTVKMPSPTSSFKKHLMQFKDDDSLLATHLAGSFVLPKDPNQKLAFIAGGVGITPFRSIIKYLLDSQQPRNAVLLYSANNFREFAFTDLFKQAKSVGLKTGYVISNAESASKGWPGFVGQINEELIGKTISDYKERQFYVSGPYGFVKTARQELIKLGLPHRQIITDYFPGYG